MKSELNNLLKNKVVLVAGGTGSIGSQVVNKLLEYPVRQIRIYSRDEYKQFMLEQKLQPVAKEKISFLIGDVRDRERVFMAAEGVDIIFDAAAMKHVQLCEYNPFEAIKTNVLGTQNLVDAARNFEVEKFVYVSTDKAASPVSVMGATKLLAEKIVSSAKNYKGVRKTSYCVVRFGNVLGSRGSVIPVFYDQIKSGGPVKITNPKMTRFIMHTREAVDLILQAAVLCHDGELFILKMPSLRIDDLAKAMIETLGPRFGHKPANIAVVNTGMRPGEKMDEILITEGEADGIFENRNMFCAARKRLTGFSPSATTHYRSSNGSVLPYKEVLELIKNYFADNQADV